MHSVVGISAVHGGEDVKRRKTVVAVAIAHRLSTIVMMDRLIVLDAGKVIEEGSHGELLTRNGLYARLWAHQSGGFLGEQEPEGEQIFRRPAAVPLK